VLRPGDTWTVGSPHGASRGDQFRRGQSDSGVHREPFTSPSVAVSKFEISGAELAARNRRHNSVSLMKIIELLYPALLGAVTIWLWDQRVAARFTPSAGPKISDGNESGTDVSMHSSSLACALLMIGVFTLFWRRDVSAPAAATPLCSRRPSGWSRGTVRGDVSVGRWRPIG
jgi:hypothetical protein